MASLRKQGAPFAAAFRGGAQRILRDGDLAFAAGVVALLVAVAITVTTADFQVLIATAAAALIAFATGLLVLWRLARMRAAQVALVTLVQAGGMRIFRTHDNGTLKGEALGAAGPDWPRDRRSWRAAVHPEDRIRLPYRREDQSPHLCEIRLKNPHTDDYRWHRLMAVPEPEGWACALADIHDKRIEEEQRELLVGELRHRLKNLFTIVESLAKNSRYAGTPEAEDYFERFRGRLYALRTAGDLVLAGGRGSLEASAVIRASLAPFMEEDGGRFELDGPEIALSERTGGSLAFAVHEMATNAIKYGALSVPDGTVSFRWRRTETKDGERIQFEWKERGGPRPEGPEREGFGTKLIKFTAANEAGQSVTLDYPPDGFRCTIAFTRVRKAAA